MYEKFRNKKIAVLGFGVEGKATYEELLKHGIEATILDRAEKEDFLKQNPDIKSETVLGKDYLGSLSDFEVIFKSPGIPILLPEIQKAIDAGIKVTSQIEFFFENAPGTIIGLTGTKGKGTTSSLIYEILKKAKKKVFLAGNIGLPAIDFLDSMDESSIMVLELSSFQLQTLKRSPKIAVILNITSDHLDYHQTVKEYREAKANIVRFQKKDDFAVINADYEVPMDFAKKSAGQKKYFSKEKPVNGCYVQGNRIFLETTGGVISLLDTKELQLKGAHNLENITAAIEAAYLAGADERAITEAVKDFKGLEHRLEFVREFENVKYYNDSFSTVPETAIAAINSFAEPKIIILGGSYKGSNYNELGKVIRQSNTKALILVGQMAAEIEKAVGADFKGKKIIGISDMGEMVKAAREIAQKGDVVLLSPACASFGLFKNYKDRGEQFKNAVRRIS